MLARSHVIFGVGSYLVAGDVLINQQVINNLQLTSEWFYFLPLAILGALVPDIDHHNATIQKNLLIKILTIPLRLFGHRTWSHSLLILVVMWLMFSMFLDGLFWIVAFAFWVGYASHIIGDWMTPSRVQLLYPITYRFSSPISFRTGSFFEYYIALLPLVIFVFIQIWKFI